MAIDFSSRIGHVMPVGIKTQRREKRHEEHVGRVRIQNPNRLAGRVLPLAQQRRRHPVLGAVLLPQTGPPRPRRKSPRRHRSLVGAPALQHSHVEPPGEVVHVDAEGGFGAAAGRTGGDVEEGVEVGADVEGADEDGVGEGEDEDGEEREDCFSEQFHCSLSLEFF